MRCRVLLFAGLREAVGQDALEVEVGDPATVAALRRSAEEAAPALAGRTYSVAVEARYAAPEDLLPEAAELAFIPPVSGG